MIHHSRQSTARKTKCRPNTSLDRHAFSRSTPKSLCHAPLPSILSCGIAGVEQDSEYTSISTVLNHIGRPLTHVPLRYGEVSHLAKTSNLYLPWRICVASLDICALFFISELLPHCCGRSLRVHVAKHPSRLPATQLRPGQHPAPH